MREGLGALVDRGREDRRALGGLAARDGPVLDPAGATFTDESVGQAVGLISERVFESDEAIAAFAHHVEQFTDVVGLELTGVEQENLLGLVAD